MKQIATKDPKDTYSATGGIGNVPIWIDQSLPNATTNNTFTISKRLERGAGALSLLFLSATGAGNVSARAMTDPPAQTGSRPYEFEAVTSCGIPCSRQEILTSGERVERAKSILGLKTTEVAAILGVERQTIYAWTSGQTEPQPRNRQRIEDLCGLAQRWASLTGKPVRRYLHHPVEGKGSLYEMLCAETIDSEAIYAVLREIGEKLNAEAPRPTRETVTLLDGVQVEWMTGI